MRAATTLALALGLAAALAVACGQDGTALDAALEARQDQDLGAAGSARAPLDERLAQAPEDVAYQGLRRVRQTFEVDGAPREVEYVERVTADGRGGFAVAIEDVVVPALSPQDEEVFVALQENRQGFLYESRDFRIRSLELFRQTYAIRQLGEAVEVAGRDCVLIEVRRRDGARRVYELAVDVDTGLVLRSQERSLDGRLLSSSEFVTLALGAPAQDAPLFERPFARRPIDPDVPTVEQVGFPPLEPTLVPEGYRLARVDFVPVPLEDGSGERNWLRFVYEDGVEQLFFLHSPEPEPAQGPTTPQAASGAPEFTDDHVKVAEIGPWRVVDGVVRGEGVVALGKVPEPQLLQMVQSALARRR